MDIAQVEGLIRERGIEVVKMGGSDMNGVFRGKRMLAEHFIEGCKSGHGFGQCDVIFGWDIAEQLIDGLTVGSASTGFGDVVMLPDLDTFRIVPWEESAAAVVCDYATAEGEPLAVSPRQVLRRVVERAQSMGYRPMMSAEFEVRLFREDQQSLRAKRFSDLEPLNPGLNCYSIHHASMDEDVVGRIRRMMSAYGVPVEGYNREHGEGMYEINLRYADALTAADNAMLYKSGVKEIAAQQGVVPTFMAKYDDRIDGCSGHLHQSLWSRDGRNAFWDDGAARHASEVMRSYTAGVLSTLPELMLLYAPNVNSYKRFVAGSWAPTTATWGFENRTTALRAITVSANGCRLETRVPGADLNAYLGFAATLAGGLHGIERKLEPPVPVAGDAYRASEAPGLPRSLAEAVDCFRGSAVARQYFGDEFVEHYARMRAWEVEQFRRAVTDWERARYFEQV
jgi:glutamine synthetase